MSRSRLAEALCLMAAIAIGANVALSDNLKTTLAPIVIKTTAPATIAPAAAAVDIAAHSVTTIKPVALNNVVVKQDIKKAPKETVAPIANAPISLHLSTAKPVAAVVASGSSTVAAALSPADRVSQYFEPVCGQLEKLQPKQMFKIQSQLKQFVEKTAGKMSLCFMQTYSMDPNLTPVNKAQLQTICSSRKLDLSAKGSFKSFLECARTHYDLMLDAELARIQKSRSDLGVNHDHSKDNLASLPHDDDELSLISEVVNKVMADSKMSPAKTDIKILDLNAPKSDAPVVPIVIKTTALPVAVVSKPTTALPVVKLAPVTQAPSLADKLKPSSTPSGKLLNDPNTVVLFVDDNVGNLTTKAPLEAAPVLVLQTTVAPKPVRATTPLPVILVTTSAAPKQLTPVTTGKPAEIKLVVTTSAPAKSGGLGEKIVVAASVKTTAAPVGAANATKTITLVTEAPKPASTVAPIAANAKTTAAAQLKITVVTTTGKPAAGTTKKPEAGSTAAPKASVAPIAVLSGSGKTTEKPLKKVVEAVKKQEKVAEKKEDDLDAKKAIKSLQAQRAQAHGSPADIRMHQIEHERQMSIDPVGHTIKHQEYEKKKAGLSAAKTTTSTTRKPQ